ncbi:TetR/AcrR family transcriptional regulator [Actinomadura rudentiformis]|uniref:TetR/AcrR family transcriptional regulator n=1 Tax=Actinomadura rudentiformis TaxID=359158 RepID=A0A6H9YL05_9ACTN|nr:TetR/AcrR family transcriptional regulator [Actinomadura rudentiformis]KAB2346411.1 TetR/AcrR family transcriptional regulator [Actinomadura rudentiformis]
MTGRPREFDVDERLDRALEVFWRQGYEGTALSDLTKAMGINKPSLYAAYGNKDALFIKVLDRYATGPANYATKAMAEPTARATAETLMRGAIELTTSAPGGCLFVQGALATGQQGAAARKELTARRQAGHAALRARFERAQAEGDLPPDADPNALSRLIWATTNGLSVQATSGATAEELHQAVDLLLTTWPLAGVGSSGLGGGAGVEVALFRDAEG